MTLSLLLLKKYYDKVVLYTTIEIANIVREIGLPYDEINDVLLENVTTRTFSIPKLLVYSIQTEPFIHIDLDMFLFKKIKFDYKSIYSTYDEGIGCDFKMDKRGLGFFSTYIKNSFNLMNKLPVLFRDEINFSSIPNMSIFGGFDYDLISESTLYCLNIYEKNRVFFDSEFYNACIIEQLFIPSAIRMLNKNNLKSTEITYLFPNLPNTIECSDEKNIDYPFIINSLNDLLVINNDFDLYENILYDFNGVLHLCGYKNSNMLLFLLRSKIMIQFDEGYKYLEKINKIFKYEEYDFEKNREFYDTIKINYRINLRNKKLM